MSNKHYEPVMDHLNAFGAQLIFRFPNGYGASVIYDNPFLQSPEICTIMYGSPDTPHDDFELCPDTTTRIDSIDQSVLSKHLAKIEALPPRKGFDPDVTEQA